MRVPVVGTINHTSIVMPTKRRLELTVPDPVANLAAITHQFGDHRDNYAMIFSPDRQTHPSLSGGAASLLVLKDGRLLAGHPIHKGGGRYDVYIWNQCVRRDVEIETAMPAQIVF